MYYPGQPPKMGHAISNPAQALTIKAQSPNSIIPRVGLPECLTPTSLANLQDNRPAGSSTTRMSASFMQFASFPNTSLYLVLPYDFHVDIVEPINFNARRNTSVAHRAQYAL
ncbi:hypothetical protein LIER_31197 [Lithospermum erythrorhizon]|uniref:Uncharacterized protein n=1 Tax=Lithospermum erythrorhizon TaxID=34254 RepID=A0AAV3RTE5_LITER